MPSFQFQHRPTPARRPALAALAVLAIAVPSCWSLSDPLPAAPCEPGHKLCEGACVLLDDPNHGCAAESCYPCSDAHGTPSCEEGQCAMSSCEQGWGDCIDDPTDDAAAGCETDLVDNREHCGMCGYHCGEMTCGCLDDECAYRGCGSIQIAAHQNVAWAIVAGDEHVYWTNDDPVAGVWRTRRDSSNPDDAEIYSAQEAGSRPHGLAIDASHLYWVSDNPSAVRRAEIHAIGPVSNVPINGDLVSGVIGGPRHATGIAVDTERVYWADRGDENADPIEPPSIWSVDKAGSDTPERVVQIEFDWAKEPNLLAVDEAHVFWTAVDHGSVFVADKSGEPPGTAVQRCSGSSEGMGWGIALDDEQVYWREGGFLRAASKTPSDPCPDPPPPQTDRYTSRFMVLHGQCLFWMWNEQYNLWADSRIVVTRTDGADMRVIAIAPTGAHGIAVDDEWVYWTDYDNTADPDNGVLGQGGVYKVARPPVVCN